MNETIHIPTDRLRPGILQFVRSSPLADCSTLIVDEDRIAVRPSWPVAGFSSGEQAAWRVLCSLVDGDLRRLIERCDADTVAALVASLSTIRFELVSA